MIFHSHSYGSPIHCCYLPVLHCSVWPNAEPVTNALCFAGFERNTTSKRFDLEFSDNVQRLQIRTLQGRTFCTEKKSWTLEQSPPDGQNFSAKLRRDVTPTRRNSACASARNGWILTRMVSSTTAFCSDQSTAIFLLFALQNIALHNTLTG